jgi:hypothetical protein
LVDLCAWFANQLIIGRWFRIALLELKQVSRFKDSQSHELLALETMVRAAGSSRPDIQAENHREPTLPDPRG